jgi:hypothetical protein
VSFVFLREDDGAGEAMMVELFLLFRLCSKSTGGAVDGTISFATSALAPGAYEAVLVSKAGSILARMPFCLYAPGTQTKFSTSKSIYKSGEPIVVSWTDAPGMRWDWVGLYKPGQGVNNTIVTSVDYANAARGGPNADYLFNNYTHASIEGAITITASSYPGYAQYGTWPPGSWPLQPGNYEFRLMLDDGYRTLALSASFTVTK